MALNQDAVVAAAIELVDEVGLDGLSFRALARRLGVSAPTLYWHVDDKAQLVDLMAEAILGDRRAQTEPRHGQSWWAWLAEGALESRAAMLAHRDGARIVAGNRPTPNTFEQIEARLAALVAVGFPPPRALDVVLSIGDLVMGSVLETQAQQMRSPDDGEIAEFRKVFADGRYQTLRGVLATFDHDPERRFRDGLRWWLTGLRLAHAELVGIDLDPDGTAAQVREAVPG